jgi:spoIIIJ-associated protein
MGEFLREKNTVDTMREIESSGSTIEEATAAGLEKLGVERERVDVEVLDEGSRGLLGIGARAARVRLTLKPDAITKEASVPLGHPEQDVQVEAAETESAVEPEPEPETERPAIDDELQAVAPIARQTLEELLEKMGIQARVEDYVRQPEDEEDYHKLVLNIRGRDLGTLIGRRGETLDAIQYLTRLIVGRELERWINLVVDVEGYRVRRERSLRQLAERMAERAVKTGRRQVLEPMSAAERRIVHVALRHHAEVITQSVGQDENRKVTIILRDEK